MDHITYGALKGISSTGILLVSTEGERQTTRELNLLRVLCLEEKLTLGSSKWEVQKSLVYFTVEKCRKNIGKCPGTVEDTVKMCVCILGVVCIRTTLELIFMIKYQLGLFVEEGKGF